MENKQIERRKKQRRNKWAYMSYSNEYKTLLKSCDRRKSERRVV